MKFALGISILLVSFAAHCEEADQFMTWGVELNDAAPVLNEYINAKIDAILKAAEGSGCSCEELVDIIFRDIYLDRLRDDLTAFASESEKVDVFPPRTVDHGEMMDSSIYRNAPTLSLIRLMRTVRVGEVYVGIDKFAHLFGIGRRYYARYLDDRIAGATPNDAEENAILWGAMVEDTVLGSVINGIFSHADLEANFQGLRLARTFCEGDAALLKSNEGAWRITQPFDLREWVNPAFDESFNVARYTDDLLNSVVPILRGEYAEKANQNSVESRFKRYREMMAVSRSMEIIRDYLVAQSAESQYDVVLRALNLQPGDPAAPFDAMKLDSKSD